MEERHLLREQIEYYQARAAEYERMVSSEKAVHRGQTPCSMVCEVALLKQPFKTGCDLARFLDWLAARGYGHSIW
jgi:hypothetical protein